MATEVRGIKPEVARTASEPVLVADIEFYFVQHSSGRRRAAFCIACGPLPPPILDVFIDSNIVLTPILLRRRQRRARGPDAMRI